MAYNPSNPADVAAKREAIRTAIFTSKPKSKKLEVFGVEIELRQPSLGVILNNQNVSAEDRPRAVADMLIRFAYVPDSSIRVFEDVDVDGILGLPFGSEMQKIQEAINELTDVAAKVEEAKGNLPTT